MTYAHSQKSHEKELNLQNITYIMDCWDEAQMLAGAANLIVDLQFGLGGQYTFQGYFEKAYNYCIRRTGSVWILDEVLLDTGGV